jgi:hypothetical protein
VDLGNIDIEKEHQADTAAGMRPSSGGEASAGEASEPPTPPAARCRGRFRPLHPRPRAAVAAITEAAEDAGARLPGDEESDWQGGEEVSGSWEAGVSGGEEQEGDIPSVLEERGGQERDLQYADGERGEPIKDFADGSEEGMQGRGRKTGAGAVSSEFTSGKS